MLQRVQLWTFALLFLQQGVNAFPRGAPSIACGSYIPSHGALVQSPETAPYTVVADRNYFDFREAGADRVVVNITSASGEPFKGFVVAAFDAAGKPFGSFESTSEAHQVPKCDKPAMTHNDATLKTHVSLVWLPPAGGSQEWGFIQFRSTVVKSMMIYWVNLPFTAPEII